MIHITSTGAAVPQQNPENTLPPLPSEVVSSSEAIVVTSSQPKIFSSAHLGADISFGDLLNFAIESEASDIHFSEKERIALRVHGSIRFLQEIPPLTHEKMEEFLFGMIKNDLHKKRYLETKELDFAHEHSEGTNFRVNAFFKRGKMAVVMRRIASRAQSLEELGLPEAIRELLSKKQGLILVTGPTGSGKSTSMQSMLEWINDHRVEHILTIEDPVEFIFASKKSIFSQREIGRDTESFPNALRAALREDPDVVMIGEMRDPETIMAAMNLSETGHLVISTLHTSSAMQTVSRTVSAFPPEQQFQIQARLADTLIGVISQRLVPRMDRAGRVAIFELMIVNNAVRNLIRNGELSQIYNAMMAGRGEGMVLMQSYAEELERQGVIAAKEFQGFFRTE